MSGRCFCHYFCILSHLQIGLGMTLVEGYVHGDANIRLGSLKRWLPMNHRELPELLEIEFAAILPERKQHDQRYTQHPIIRKNFNESVRERSVNVKRIRVDLRWKQRRTRTLKP